MGSQSLENKENSRDNESAKSLVKQKVEREEAPSASFIFLAFLLFLTCLNLLANNLLINTARTNAKFWIAHLGLSLNDTPRFISLAKNLSLVSIFTGVFTGLITDILSAPVALILMSIMSLSGLLLFILNTYIKAPVIFYEISIIIYGGAMNQARIPMQKMASVLFAGPYLATAMNINHTFSHISSLLATTLAPVMSNSLGIIPTIRALALVGWFTLPICMILYGLYTKRISVKGAANKDGLVKMLTQYITETEYLAWIVLAMGFFTDGITVSFKNTESAIYAGYDYSRTTTNMISTASKVVLIFTPFYSLFVDLFTYRQYFFIVTTSMQTLLFFILWLISLKKNYSLPVWAMIIIMLAYKLFTTIFLAAFYSYLAVTIPKSIRGVAFGFNNSVLSIAYYFGSMIISTLSKNIPVAMFFSTVCAGIGCGLSILIWMLNYKLGDTLNKDRIAREKEANK
eukprot:GAHX01000326.1.p1 GENE.GAHX01000326.1~~GAHX01000326.1.p1  ORF type:complete len:458 (+),score=42.28 GAHX01000326.1:43-1416(+)